MNYDPEQASMLELLKHRNKFQWHSVVWTKALTGAINICGNILKRHAVRLDFMSFVLLETKLDIQVQIR